MIILISFMILAIVAIVAIVIAGIRIVKNTSVRLDTLETGVKQATRLAISAGARCSKIDGRCDGITSRITALAKFNNLRQRP